MVKRFRLSVPASRVGKADTPSTSPALNLNQGGYEVTEQRERATALKVEHDKFQTTLPVKVEATRMTTNNGHVNGDEAQISIDVMRNGSPVRNDFFNFLNPGDLPFLLRRNILDMLIDPRHNIDRECGYPPDITPLMYHLMYQRDGIARKVVELWPNESWAMDPLVYEDEDEDVETDFESEWTRLLRKLNLWHHLHRLDVLSGVARFGILLLGLDDGRPYSEPAVGLNPQGLPVLNKKGEAKAKHKLLFVRPFDETACQVLQREVNPQNPRFGKPTRYLLTFRELDITEPAMLGTTAGGMVTSQVHWTRVVHVADNREMSEIYGVPRMKPHWNRLCDIRKTVGGSAEMFWKGAFPGISFEMAPGVSVNDGEIDRDELREQIEHYQGGLQRYLAVAGLSAKSLAPQVSDPKNHVEIQLDQIAIGMGVPKRVFMGSEQAQLAASQDSKAWNKRVARRQDKYLGPMLIREFIDRLLALGVLPKPAMNKKTKEPDEYEIYFPDLAAATDQEKAQLTLTKTQACATYISGNVDQLIPPEEYLTMIHDMDSEQAQAILRAQREYMGTRINPEHQVEIDPDYAGDGPDTPEAGGTPNQKQRGESTRLAEQTNESPVEQS